MKVSLSEQGVPFVISYRKILRRPKVERSRKFVGPVTLIKKMMLKAIEFVDDLAFETETKVVDPGQSVVVHWAVDIEDPWDVAPGREANLVGFRMLEDMPPCGAHFEIISPPPTKNGTRVKESSVLAPEDLQGGNGAASDGGRLRGLDPSMFVRPPADAYAPRPVKPLVDSLIHTDSEAEDDSSQYSEAAPDLEGPGGIGEDD